MSCQAAGEVDSAKDSSFQVWSGKLILKRTSWHNFLESSASGSNTQDAINKQIWVKMQHYLSCEMSLNVASIMDTSPAAYASLH